MSLTVRISSGLGNQMFQYAFARLLARRSGEEVLLDIGEYRTDLVRSFELDRFAVGPLHLADPDSAPLARLRAVPDRLPKGLTRRIARAAVDILVHRCLTPVWPRYIEDRSFRFDPAYLRPRPGAYYSGYWQSYRYVDPVADEIRTAFRPAVPLDGRNARLAEDMASRESVAVHFRRGDYAAHKSIRAPRLVPCPPDYYLRALERIRSSVGNPVFYVFSDEIPWVRENFFRTDRAIFVEGNSGAEAYKDILLMAAARHNVVANSTFSWWGAWLNSNPGKIVVRPARWFNRSRLNSRAGGLCPPDWIAV